MHDRGGHGAVMGKNFVQQRRTPIMEKIQDAETLDELAVRVVRNRTSCQDLDQIIHRHYTSSGDRSST